MRLTAITFLPEEEPGRGQRLVIHLANDSKRPARVSRVRLWQPATNRSYRVLHAQEPLSEIEVRGGESIPAVDSGVVVARLGAGVPLSYVAVEVMLAADEEAGETQPVGPFAAQGGGV